MIIKENPLLFLYQLLSSNVSNIATQLQLWLNSFFFENELTLAIFNHNFEELWFQQSMFIAPVTTQLGEHALYNLTAELPACVFFISYVQ